MQNKHFMKLLDYTQTSRQWNPKEQLFNAMTGQVDKLLSILIKIQ